MSDSSVCMSVGVAVVSVGVATMIFAKKREVRWNLGIYTVIIGGVYFAVGYCLP